MTTPVLIEKLCAGSPLLSAWCSLPEPSISGHLAREAFDAVTIDMQHGGIDFAATIRAIPLIAAASKPAIVRVPVGDFATASRFLDAGASAVIAPMINTIQDARRFASFMKYPPIGERSWGPHAALALSGLQPGDYFAKGNGLSAAFAMVETREALNIVDDILGEQGIDGVFVGPADLSIALSGGAAMDASSAAVEQALDHVLARARAAKKFAAIYAANGERAADFVRKGFNLVAVGSDVHLLRMGTQMALKAARS